MGPCCLPQKKNYIYQQSQLIVKSNFKKKQQIPQWAVRRLFCFVCAMANFQIEIKISGDYPSTMRI